MIIHIIGLLDREGICGRLLKDGARGSLNHIIERVEMKRWPLSWCVTTTWQSDK